MMSSPAVHTSGRPSCGIAVAVLLAISSVVKLPASDSADSPVPFNIGIIADCQYCNDPGSGVRKYALSAGKLDRCVNHLNTLDLACVMHLGDFIDRDFGSFDVVVPIYNRLHAPGYHVLGNHDFSVADEKKAEIPTRLGLKSRYYDFVVKGWRFVVLDGNDVSFHAHPVGSPEWNEAESYYETKAIDSPKWNGAVGADQLAWLDEVLAKAAEKGQNVIVYCHFPVHPQDVHNLWNASEVIAVLERHSSVKPYMNGHNHAGNYGLKNGIHYVTFKGMVDTKETSYATVRVFGDRLEISGYGREENRILKIFR